MKQTSYLVDEKGKKKSIVISLDILDTINIGDFYDILSISDRITAYFVADFSGHDIQISYMTASVKALLAQNCTPVYSPAESMKMINDVLVEIMPDGKYLTACYMHLNRATHKLTIINAGHPPVVVLNDGYSGGGESNYRPGSTFHCCS